MDPINAEDGFSMELIGATMSGLYTLDAEDNLVPDLATECTVSEDGMTYTFKIREDAKWSDGEPLTAHDFVFAWKRLADPAVAGAYAWMLDEVLSVKNAAEIATGELPVDELGVSAPDDYTFEVQLTRPVPYFEHAMVFTPFFPLNEKFVTEQGDNFALTVDGLLFSGPYKMTEWDVGGTRMVLEKNENYYNADSIQTDVINYQIIADTQQAVMSYENGDIDFVKLTGDLVNQYRNEEGFSTQIGGYIWHLVPNCENEFLSNANLRRAISSAIDRDTMVNSILNDGSVVATGYVLQDFGKGPDGKYFRETAPSYTFTDKEKAVEYWELAKEELGTDAVTFTLLYEDSESASNVAAFIQSEIETTLPGVTVEMQSVPKKVRIENMQNFDFDLALNRWGADYDDPYALLNLYTSDRFANSNYGRWVNEEFDSLIYSARDELATQPEERWQALIDAEAVMMDELPLIPLYQNGEATDTREVSLKAGENRYAFSLVAQKTGVVTYEARLVSGEDTQSQNNRLAAYARVLGAPNVLLVEEAGTAEKLFSASGMRVERIRPAAMPSGADGYLAYDAVVSAISQPVDEQVVSIVFVLEWA